MVIAHKLRMFHNSNNGWWGMCLLGISQVSACTHSDKPHQHLHYGNSFHYQHLCENSDRVYSHFPCIGHHPTRLVPILFQNKHLLMLKQLQEIPVLYRQLQHQLSPTNHHTQYPILLCRIPPHVLHVDHAHQQVELLCLVLELQ